MSAEVRDIVTVYQLGGGSGFLATFIAECAECRWAAGSHTGGGGGSPTPWVSDEQARALAQGNADKHNHERHEVAA